MVLTTTLQRFPDSRIAAIRALSSLTQRDADAVRATVRLSGADVTIHEHDDYDGYLALLLSPADETATSFLVSGRTGAVHVAAIDGDMMTTLGTFPSIGSAMMVLRPALRAVPFHTSPASTAERLRAKHGDTAAIHAALNADADLHRRHWSSVLRALDDRDDNA